MDPVLFLADFFGVSNGTFLHWMLAISLTLLVLDVFCNTEFLSWISMLVFSLWGTMQFELPVQWSVLVYIVILIICAVFYYTLWARIAATALRSMQGICTRPQMGSQVRPR